MQDENLYKNAFEKAKEALITAEINIENDLLTSAQNRIYYAIFYAVTALAYKHDFITSKHGQLISWFNKKFVFEDKVFSKELFKIYKYNFENRQKADYDFTYSPLKDDVEQSLEDAKYFVEKIKEYLFQKNP